MKSILEFNAKYLTYGSGAFVENVEVSNRRVVEFFDTSLFKKDIGIMQNSNVKVTLFKGRSVKRNSALGVVYLKLKEIRRHPGNSLCYSFKMLDAEWKGLGQIELPVGLCNIILKEPININLGEEDEYSLKISGEIMTEKDFFAKVEENIYVLRPNEFFDRKTILTSFPNFTPLEISKIEIIDSETIHLEIDGTPRSFRVTNSLDKVLLEVKPKFYEDILLTEPFLFEKIR